MRALEVPTPVSILQSSGGSLSAIERTRCRGAFGPGDHPAECGGERRARARSHRWHSRPALIHPAGFAAHEVSRRLGRANLATSDPIVARPYPSDYVVQVEGFEVVVARRGYGKLSVAAANKSVIGATRVGCGTLRW